MISHSASRACWLLLPSSMLASTTQTVASWKAGAHCCDFHQRVALDQGYVKIAIDGLVFDLLQAWDLSTYPFHPGQPMAPSIVLHYIRVVPVLYIFGSTMAPMHSLVQVIFQNIVYLGLPE